jgi:hypothetical protein
MIATIHLLTVKHGEVYLHHGLMLFFIAMVVASFAASKR